MRLGVDEVGITELMGVTEHARALAIAAAALLLESLGEGERSLVPPLDPSHAEEPVRGLLAEIAAWSGETMGRAEVPVFWRILAHNAHYLEATWRKELAVMGTGALPAHDKRRIALGVAMSARGGYMIQYHAEVLRRGGDTDRDILEVLGVVDYFTALNTLADGMQIESDIRPTVTKTGG